MAQRLLKPKSRRAALREVRYRFQGRERSAATGLANFRMRWYDAVTGRWLSKDPIGLSGGLNLYAFCGNGPVNFVDFFGACPEEDSEIITPSGYHIKVPPGVDIDNNIKEAKGRWSPFWFRSQVQNKGPWDYKQRGSQYEDFGNFNYGATGRALWFPAGVLLREAGRAQKAAGTSKPEWGSPGYYLFGGSGSFGDDPKDQTMIREGMKYYDRKK